MPQTNSSLGLNTLPTEIQCSILRLLDPISLVSVSQTCRDFRATINPQRRHFIERLLALECLEEYGGVTPIFRARDNTLRPGWDDEKWEAMRWACTGCLRLLPHQNFDNHSLLRLRYRKPIPGSPAALAPSSWEPSGKTISGTILKRRKELEQIEMKRLKRQYGIATTLNWGQPRQGQSLSDRLQAFREAGMEEFINMTLEEFEGLNTFEESLVLDHVAEAVERQRCGSKRHLRKCNECRFQQGDLHAHTTVCRSVSYQTGANLGTKTVPIVISRRLGFGSYLDRYFPSFREELAPSRPSCSDPPVFTIYRHNAHEHFFTLYSIRCPKCKRWLEMRAFRCGGLWPKWWPAYRHRWRTWFRNWDLSPVDEEFVNAMRCNSCYAEEHGEEKLLGKLMDWFQFLAKMHKGHLEYMLNYGWSTIWNSVDPGMCGRYRDIPRKYHFEIRSEVLAGLPWKNYDEQSDGIDYEKADLKVLSRKHKLWMEVWPKFREEPEIDYRFPDFVDWFDCWMVGYDRLQSHWVWVRRCQQELEKRPDLLCDWARRSETCHAR